MTLEEFLEQSAGNWFAQRTQYFLEQDKFENSKSEITVERLFQEHPETIRLCQAHQIDPGYTRGGLKTSWDHSAERGAKQKGFAIIILVPETDAVDRGKLLQTTDSSTSLAGNYVFGEDEALTLNLSRDNTASSERLWFASPNLRLRTSIIRHQGEVSSTSFYSEIRRITQPA